MAHWFSSRLQSLSPLIHTQTLQATTSHSQFRKDKTEPSVFRDLTKCWATLLITQVIHPSFLHNSNLYIVVNGIGVPCGERMDIDVTGPSPVCQELLTIFPSHYNLYASIVHNTTSLTNQILVKLEPVALW
jgi:hypothetical protein